MIRKGTLEDVDAIVESYIELLLHEQKHGGHTVWKLGVYPTRETARQGVENGNLYVMVRDGEICASIIANQDQPEEYNDMNWKCHAKSDEVFVIHLLCVRPSKSRCGIGKELVKFVLEEGRRRNCRVVRLDTGEQNKPAVALYQKLGFEIAGTSTMIIGGRIVHKNHLFFEKIL